jgi:large subunit ribosomal protein L19
MNLLHKYEEKHLASIMEGKQLPQFKAGDTLRVHVRVVEGANERVQMFEGLCIARKNRGLGSTFAVRKISHDEGVERIFPLFSPRIEKIEVMKVGRVRRAKLYYIRDLRGRAARIKEKVDYNRKKK